MYRRFLVRLLRRSILVLVLVCLGCSAQSAPSDLVQKIERQVRATYSVPASVKIIVGPPRPSEFPNYDLVTIGMEGDDKKQSYDFLLSKDGTTLLRMTKLDLTKDPYVEIMKKINVSGRPTRGAWQAALSGDYTDAVEHMQNYLGLLPNATDAQSARPDRPMEVQSRSTALRRQVIQAFLVQAIAPKEENP